MQETKVMEKSDAGLGDADLIVASGGIISVSGGTVILYSTPNGFQFKPESVLLQLIRAHSAIAHTQLSVPGLMLGIGMAGTGLFALGVGIYGHRKAMHYLRDEAKDNREGRPPR